MDLQPVQNFLGNNQSTLNWMISAFSLGFALISLFVSWQVSKTSRINSNSWETYRTYFSPELREARRVARQVEKDSRGNGVQNEADYRRFFRLDEPLEGPDVATLKQLRSDEQHIHYLLNFYHQIGIMLKRGLLDEDFTMFLLGGGLGDRWPVIGRVPCLYNDFPYQGVYEMYHRFNKWKKSRLPRLINKRAQSEREHAFAETFKTQDGVPQG